MSQASEYEKNLIRTSSMDPAPKWKICRGECPACGRKADVSINANQVARALKEANGEGLKYSVTCPDCQGELLVDTTRIEQGRQGSSENDKPDEPRKWWAKLVSKEVDRD